MEYVLFLVLLIVWPFRAFIQLFLSKKTPHKKHFDTPKSICQIILEKNLNKSILWASSKNYTDMWTRDTFFACMSGNEPLKKKVFAEIAKYQRKDGLIPLYIGKGDACCKLFCNQKPLGITKAFYCDAKTGDEPTDSCSQFIIAAYSTHPAQSMKAWQYMQKYVRNHLIYETGLGTWQDTIKHSGHVAYTNILYYQATKLLFPDQPEKAIQIKRRIIETLWNGNFFVCSTTNSSFGQVDNALALIYKLVPNEQKAIDSIFNTHLMHFSQPISPPNLKIDGQTSSEAFNTFDIYMPCWPIGNAKYHNGWSWSWVNLLFIKAKKMYGKPYDISWYKQMIQNYGTLHETYDLNGPVKRVLYNSQPDFSEACGLFLEVESSSQLFF